jgi:oxygen-independent coproporphyrinogen-3 oxidase
MERVEREGTAAAGSESLNETKAAAEFMFMGLRMTEGVSVEEFLRRFGKMPQEFYPRIGTWLDEGLMEQDSRHIRLTHRGFMLANEIFVAFV